MCSKMNTLIEECIEDLHVDQNVALTYYIAKKRILLLYKIKDRIRNILVSKKDRKMKNISEKRNMELEHLFFHYNNEISELLKYNSDYCYLSESLNLEIEGIQHEMSLTQEKIIKEKAKEIFELERKFELSIESLSTIIENLIDKEEGVMVEISELEPEYNFTIFDGKFEEIVKNIE